MNKPSENESSVDSVLFPFFLNEIPTAIAATKITTRRRMPLFLL
jgi:hypothetical protein